MMKRRVLCGVLSGLLFAPLCVAATAQKSDDIKSALTARVSFTDLHGTQLQELPRGEPFDITVSIDNAIGNEPPAGLYLNGWLRQHSQHNLDCQSAARAYLATGRTPIGSVDLNGPVIGVLTEEGHLAVADPEIDLASANLIGATSFDEMPAAFAIDPETNRFLISLATAGEVLAANAFGGNTMTIADGLNHPGPLIPGSNGAVWVLEQGSGDLLHFGPEQSRRRMPLNISSISAGANGHSLVAWSESNIHVIGRLNANLLMDVVQEPDKNISNKKNDKIESSKDGLPTHLDVIAIEDQRSAFAVAALTESAIALYYFDEPELPVYIKLGAPAQKLAVDSAGRFLFAYSPEGGDTSIVDIARSQVVQVVGASTPVINIAFTENAAFLMLADQSMVGVVELASIKLGQHAKVREVALGEVVMQKNASQKQLLAPLVPRNEMLAVNTNNFTGFVIHESAAMGDAPPMSAIKLRGGVPHHVAVINRSFREISTGTFRTTAVLPAKGQFELVVTTGIGSLSACMPVNIEGGDTANDLKPGTISIMPMPADETSATQGARLLLHQADGEPAQKVRAEVTFSALEANWLLRADLITDHTGISQSSYDLPALGEYVITVATETEREFQPILFRVE